LDNGCYLGIFPTGDMTPDKDMWYIGSMLMTEYYTVFSSDGYMNDKVNVDYFMVGFAPKNPINKIGESSFDWSAIPSFRENDETKPKKVNY